jgi:SOS-response transcriptional repressor LexA
MVMVHVGKHPTPEKVTMVNLTTRQRCILDFIVSHLAVNGYSPTFRQIGAHFGIKSTNGVHDHILALVRKGYLEKGARGVMVVKRPEDDLLTIPNAEPKPPTEDTSVETRLDRIEVRLERMEKMLERVYAAFSAVTKEETERSLRLLAVE